VKPCADVFIIIFIIIHEFHRDASLEQNFRAAEKEIHVGDNTINDVTIG